MLHINDRLRFAPDGGGSTGEGQEPSPQTTPDQNTGQDSGGGSDEIAKLRAEAAKWRTQLRDAQSKLQELTPAAQKLAELEEANKSAEQKQAERLARLETELAQQKAAVEMATKQNKLIALAAKAGVPVEVVQFLDATKFDLDNEAATLETLGALATKQQPASNPSNPGRNGANGTPSAEEWYKQQTGRKTSIFGG